MYRGHVRLLATDDDSLSGNIGTLFKWTWSCNFNLNITMVTNLKIFEYLLCLILNQSDISGEITSYNAEITDN